MSNLKFGADPEIFSAINVDDQPTVISPALMQKFSGLKVLEQDEEGKHPIFIKEQEYLWMMDGAAWEVTIRRPHENPTDLYNVLQTAQNHLRDFISQFTFEGTPLFVWNKPVVGINPELYLRYIDEKAIFQGFIFGCDPDRDALRPDYKCETLDVRTHKFRYGGGHIHVSGSDDLGKYYIPAVKLMAITAGNFVTANSSCPELDKQRATTYGRPGRYRQQNYKDGTVGVEYRTPSCEWAWNFSKEKVEQLYDLMRIAVEFTENRRGDIIESFLDRTIHAIVNADQEESSSILKELGL